MPYKNPEEYRAYQKKWRAENRALCNKLGREWRARNPEKQRACVQDWNRRNPKKKYASVQRYRKQHPEKVAEWDRRYRENQSPEQLAHARQRKREWARRDYWSTEMRQSELNRRSSRWRSFNPDKFQASTNRNPARVAAKLAVSNALRTGKLQRPKKCRRCDSTGRLQAHHHKGYARKNWLEVEWLCSICHGKTRRIE